MKLLTMDTIDFSHLMILLKAGSKDIVYQICHKVMERLPKETAYQALTLKFNDLLNITSEESIQLYTALSLLMKKALSMQAPDVSQIFSIFPSDFQKNLRNLLTKIIVENFEEIKSCTMGNTVSLPQLVDFDWRVNVTASSNSFSQMNLPTCLLQLQMQESQKSITETEVNIELTKETLDMMIDEISKIQTQVYSSLDMKA